MSSTTIPIVFIHIGDAAPPDYAEVAVRQARRWNPEAPIFFLAGVTASYSAGEQWVQIKDIPTGGNRARFEATTPLDANWRSGFWRATTERLFVLEDWMRHSGVAECLHMENDNMLYTDISRLVPTLRKNSHGISTTFQGQGNTLDQVRMCFSIVYCKSVEALSRFLFFLAARPDAKDEMQRGGQYWLDNLEECSLLPTAPKGVRLVSDTYRSWYENSSFPCVFDASAHGQYLGGEDPRNGPKGPGFVNLDTDFRTDQFLYGWKTDGSRRYPVLLDRGGKEWPIANLHIHCKRLSDFV